METEKFYTFPLLAKPLKNRHRLSLTVVMLFLCLSLFAQTNISGVVNNYYRVLEVIPAKSCVRLNTTAGLGYGDIAMLVQMKGAVINTTNTASFGDTTSLNNAGNYEIGTICYIVGDSVFFIYMMLNQYTAADKVQLVRIPQYVSATVVGELQATPWDNATGTGGVLAIWVDQDLVLNAPIVADTMGYRGGGNIVSNGTCGNALPANGYAYNGSNTAPQNGAYKGEGVADVAASQSGGRGAPANGGGGGNNHNNGGAGGANLTAGGDGGGNSSSAGCTVTLIGRRGKALSNHGGRKIFMGGGGGAGHGNNGFAASHGGGRGGGIVFIHATNLTGNTRKISANGKIGGPSASDGASGGGGGGTIIMDVDNYIGSATIEANGGDGGLSADGLNIGRCYGAGGGGSGGAIYFSGSTPAVTVNVNGGLAGAETGREASCAAAVLPGAGSAGQTFQNYSFSRSMVLMSNYCSQLLPVELIWFTANHHNGNVILKWQVGQTESLDRFIIERSVDGTNWQEINNQPAVYGKSIYTGTDASPHTSYNKYRIRVIRKNNSIIYSAIQRVYVPQKNEMINIYPNPASQKIFITGISSSPELNLYDLSGKLVWQKKLITIQNTASVDLPSLAKGIYMVKIGESVNRLVIR